MEICLCIFCTKWYQCLSQAIQKHFFSPPPFLLKLSFLCLTDVSTAVLTKGKTNNVSPLRPSRPLSGIYSSDLSLTRATTILHTCNCLHVNRVSDGIGNNWLPDN